MVTKQRQFLNLLKDSSVLAKIHMVTKLGANNRENMMSSVLAKIHMVTKLLFRLKTTPYCSVLAKIHMVTKLLAV